MKKNGMLFRQYSRGEVYHIFFEHGYEPDEARKDQLLDEQWIFSEGEVEIPDFAGWFPYGIWCWRTEHPSQE